MPGRDALPTRCQPHRRTCALPGPDGLNLRPDVTNREGRRTEDCRIEWRPPPCLQWSDGPGYGRGPAVHSMREERRRPRSSSPARLRWGDSVDQRLRRKGWNERDASSAALVRAGSFRHEAPRPPGSFEIQRNDMGWRLACLRCRRSACAVAPVARSQRTGARSLSLSVTR